MNAIGRFYGGIAALVYRASDGRYLLLRRSAEKDFAAGVWECVTGRVDQGEGFEQALHREVWEELGAQVQAELLLGTTHFYRGAPEPANELIGVVCLCRLAGGTDQLSLSAEHDAARWLTLEEAEGLLAGGAQSGSSRWILGVLRRAEALRRLAPDSLLETVRQSGFELD